MASPQVEALQTTFQNLAQDLGPMQDLRAAVVAFIDGLKAAKAQADAALAQALADLHANDEIIAAVTTGTAEFDAALTAEAQALAAAIVAGTPAEEPPAEPPAE